MTEPESMTNKAEERHKQLTRAANEVAARLNADVLLYNGDFYAQAGPDETLIDMCSYGPRRDNVLLVLVTNGGDANIAYRAARCLQRGMKTFTCWFPAGARARVRSLR